MDVIFASVLILSVPFGGAGMLFWLGRESYLQERKAILQRQQLSRDWNLTVNSTASPSTNHPEMQELNKN